jgi:hypothetical protein
VLKNRGRDDGEVGEGDTSASMQDGEICSSEFCNPMQHLLIHLPYEAKVGGPIQYRWMYHIERVFIYLKPLVDNRARVEGGITEAFTLKEVTYFSSVYFAEEQNVNAPMM